MELKGKDYEGKELTFQITDEESFIEYLGRGDGHGIYSPEKFIKMGFPVSLIPGDIFESGSNPKEQIFRNGRRVAHVEGANSLDFLRRLADFTGADTSISRTKMGRGSEAWELCVAIKAKLGIK